MLARFKNRLKKVKHGKKKKPSSVDNDDGVDDPSPAASSTSSFTKPSTQTPSAGQLSPAPPASSTGDQRIRPLSPTPSAGVTLPLAGNDAPSGSSSHIVIVESPPEDHSAVENQNSRLPSATPQDTGRLPDTAPLLDKSTSMPTSSSRMNRALTGGLKILNILAVLTGAPALDSYVKSFEEKQVVMEKGDLEKYFDKLMKSVESLKAKQSVNGKEDLKKYLDELMELMEPLTKEGGSNASQKLRDGIKGLHSSLSGISAKLGSSEESLEGVGHEVSEAVDSFMLVNCISGIINLTDTLIHVEKHVLGQRLQNLPHVDAAYDDYKSKKKSGACLEGTREALLQEIAEWIAAFRLIAQIYLLSGIAGTGKSTIAYTIAERAEQSGFLGASFFFSRDEASRSNAERFFTTIAFQLCLYDEEFAQAIEAALEIQEGAAAVTKGPEEQLKALILNPLRDILKPRSTPIVVVVDALDECDDKDAQVVLRELHRLVQELPCFKIVVTTRPRPHLPPIPSAHNVFYLQNIEDKIIDGDIQRYLEHSLSWEQVTTALPALEDKWGANENEIQYLVQATDKLFIMASTAVRFILDSPAYDPRSQLEALKVDGRVSLDDLGNFYNVILRRAVPFNKPAIAERFKVIVGTILVVQEPLPVKILGQLTQPWPSNAIKAALANLQSVIMLTNDTPRIYHKSFFDFLTDLHCADDLRIDVKAHHTRVAIRCFQVMNKALKQNILDLGTPARFMDNDDALAAENITEEKQAEKIPGELRYACIYGANHIEGADTKDVNLLKGVETFMKKHMLHWLEVLSFIRRLDTAYPAICVISEYMKPISSDLHGIIVDALRFIPRFSEQIRSSALHTYYSALSFTPTDCPLYKTYFGDTKRALCRPGGMPPQWDALVADFSQGLEAMHLTFSSDSLKFASSTEDRQEMWLWDAENGMLLRTYKGHNTAIAHDFSVAAILQDDVVALWSVASNVPVVACTPSEKVAELALSFDGSRLAVGMSDGTVGLWDTRTGEVMATLDGYAHEGGQLGFSPSNYQLAFMSDDGMIWLWNGDDEKLVARLDYESRKHIKFVFSRNGCRLASVVDEEDGYTLTLWDGEKGILIDAARNVSDVIAISEDGSFIATGGEETVQLWSGNPLLLVDTVNIGDTINCLAISHDILAIGSAEAKTLTLYDVHNSVAIASIPLAPRSLALSPDCTRLIGGNVDAALYDVPLLKASLLTSKEHHMSPVLALSFSPDSSRLAAGFLDGTVALWDTSQTHHLIVSHELHSDRVSALAFSLDGGHFGSGSWDQTVRAWDGDDGEPMGELEYSFNNEVTSVAFSPDLLATATTSDITLFDRKSLSLVGVLDNGGQSLSFSFDGSQLASASHEKITVWNVAECAAIATFTATSYIYRLTLSPDGSQLAVQLMPDDGNVEFINIVHNQGFEFTRQDISWVPTLMNGVLISWKYDHARRYRLVGRFPGRHDWIPVVWIPEDMGVFSFEAGSSILALGCYDGRILFLRFSKIDIN